MIRRWTASSNVLLLLCAMYFVTYVDRVNVSSAAAAFKAELGLSNTQLGLVFSAFAYPYLCRGGGRKVEGLFATVTGHRASMTATAK